MPFDVFGSKLEGDIIQLEKYLEAVRYVVDVGSFIPNSKLETLVKLVDDLKKQLERKQWELRAHQMRVRESGVKF